jgi:hypothetical protein
MHKNKEVYCNGKRICLWQMHIDIERKLAIVLHEVIVTIMEGKTGAPGEFSGEPSRNRSLKAASPKGLLFTKHWNYWPEAQLNDFVDQWDMRIDGMDKDGNPAEEGSFDSFWTPKESESEYRLAKHHGFKVVDIFGNPMIPKRDIIHCSTHDSYDISGRVCIKCYLESRPASNQWFTTHQRKTREVGFS